MSFVRVIPCLDMKEGRVVKGVHFVDLREAADGGAVGRGCCSDGDAVSHCAPLFRASKRQCQ